MTVKRTLTILAAAIAMASAQDKPLNTGPAIGDPIPAFEAVDQSGETRSFADLTGPNGLLLLFHRSADW